MNVDCRAHFRPKVICACYISCHTHSRAAMRNLQVLSSVLVSSSWLAGCRHIAIDYDTKLVYCTTGTSIVGVDAQLRKV